MVSLLLHFLHDGSLRVPGVPGVPWGPWGPFALIHAALDFVFILAGFVFTNCSILIPFWEHVGTIWLLWMGPVKEKLPSRTEVRWA